MHIAHTESTFCCCIPYIEFICAQIQILILESLCMRNYTLKAYKLYNIYIYKCISLSILQNIHTVCSSIISLPGIWERVALSLTNFLSFYLASLAVKYPTRQSVHIGHPSGCHGRNQSQFSHTSGYKCIWHASTKVSWALNSLTPTGHEWMKHCL